MNARGVVFLHSCMRALAPHVEWALARVIGEPVRLDWSPQFVLPGSLRAELTWEGAPGTGSALVSALVPLKGLRFEVTEDASPGREGERYALTPMLGLFRGTIGVHGDLMVSEERLRTAIAQAAVSGADVADQIALLIGQPWDDELEPYRMVTTGVRRLSRAG